MFPYIVVIILFLSRYINAPDKKKKKYKYVDLSKISTTDKNSDQRIAILNDHDSHFI